jgi:hypothetical protein
MTAFDPIGDVASVAAPAQSARMNRLHLIAAIATLISAATNAPAEPSGLKPQRGDAYEISLDREMSQRGSGGSTGSSSDRDVIVERVVGVRPDGLELEYDLPKDATSQDRARSWQFPVRVFKGHQGPMRMLNAPQLEARVDAWLRASGLTRAACGQWTFTWNAFRIECDPQSVIRTLELFDLDAVDLRDGVPVQDPMASGPAPLKRRTKDASGSTFVAEMAVNAEAVRRGRAETDVTVAMLTKKSLSLDDALREREKDMVSGTISVTFDTGSDGHVRRRTKVTKLETRRPSGQVETQTVTETIERRLIARLNS